MFGLGTQELLVIKAIIFMLSGGNNRPEQGDGLGKGISSCKKGLPELDKTEKYVIS